MLARRWLALIPLVAFLLLAGVFYLGLGTGDRSVLPSALLGKKFPEFELPRLFADTKATHESLEGKFRLVNVWATWCIECRAEHETLKEISSQYDIGIVGVNYRDDAEKARDWLRYLGNPYEFTIVDSDGSLGIDLGVYGAPETFLLDSQRTIVFKHVGAITPEVWKKQFLPLVDSLLTRTPSVVAN